MKAFLCSLDFRTASTTACVVVGGGVKVVVVNIGGVVSGVVVVGGVVVGVAEIVVVSGNGVLVFGVDITAVKVVVDILL